MARSWKLILSNAYLSGAVFGVAAFGLVLGLQQIGALQEIELISYDQYLALRVALRAAPAQPDGRVVLIAATEEDLVRLDWPVSDGLLAEILDNTLKHEPRAIGVDIYRDIPRPPGNERLMRTIERNPRIVLVFKLGEGGDQGVAPPAALRRTSQVGFSDVMPDSGGIVRRALLFMDEGETTRYSFALRLALKYLEALGISPQAGKDDPSHLTLGKASLVPFEQSDGGYVNADAGGYQFLLDFRNGPAPFATYSFSQALSSAIPAEAIRDKIVIVGVAAQSVKDFFYTPFSHGARADQTIYGITLHAQAASQLLRMAVDGSPPVRCFPDWEEWAWLMLWCMLGGLLAARVRAVWALASLALAGMFAIAALGFAAFIQAWWIPVIPPALGWLAAIGLITAHLSRLERADRVLLMQLFSRYVSRDIADDIWQRRDEFLERSGRPRPHRRTATILFSDIKGFTAVSEKLDPRDLMDWLNAYLECMANLVIQHGGIVDKFIGDAVMAVFGVPVARPDDEAIRRDAVNAVSCALAMGRELERLNTVWKEQGLPAISIRVGIFTGPIIAGSLGSMQRLEYTVIGDTVNIASRLESLDKDFTPEETSESTCRILIGEATANRLGERFRIKRVGEVRLKGKDEAILVYRVLGTTQPGEITQ